MRCSDDTLTVSLFHQHSAESTKVFLLTFYFALRTPHTAVQGLRLGKRRTCRVSRSSHARNGWRAHTRLKDRTILPSWPCTSCHLNAGGLHEYTSYEDSWSTHMPARSRQSAPTSTTLTFFISHLFLKKRRRKIEMG